MGTVLAAAEKLGLSSLGCSIHDFLDGATMAVQVGDDVANLDDISDIPDGEPHLIFVEHLQNQYMLGHSRLYVAPAIPATLFSGIL